MSGQKTFFSWCRNAHNLFGFLKSSSCLLSNKIFCCNCCHNFCDFFGEFLLFIFWLGNFEIFYSLFHLQYEGERGSVFYAFFVRKFMKFFFLQRGHLKQIEHTFRFFLFFKAEKIHPLVVLNKEFFPHPIRHTIFMLNNKGVFFVLK